MVTYISKFVFKHWYFEDIPEDRNRLMNGLDKSTAEALYRTTSIPYEEKYMLIPVETIGREKHGCFQFFKSVETNPNDAFDIRKASDYERGDFPFHTAPWMLCELILFVNFIMDFAKEHRIIIHHAMMLQHETNTLCQIRDNVIVCWKEHNEPEQLHQTMLTMLTECTLRDERRKEYIDTLEHRLKELKRWEIVDFIRDIFLQNEGLLSEVFTRSFVNPLVDRLVEKVVIPSKRPRVEDEEKEIPAELNALGDVSMSLVFHDANETIQ
jgi:hypothetical protein